MPNFGTKVKVSKIEQAKQNFARIEAMREARAEETRQAQLS
jgi:hypothetical protein